MAEETDNHGLNKYSKGDVDWSHSPDMQHIEERLVIRDSESRLSNYTPHSTATFVATDTGAVYDGDGSSWNRATRQLQGVEAETASIGKLTDFNDVRVAHSPSQLHEMLHEAGENAVTADSRQVVMLKPNEIYNISKTVEVPSWVCLWSMNANLQAAADVDLLRMDAGSLQTGPLRLRTKSYDGYTSSALVTDATKASKTPISGEIRNVEMAGPVKLEGGEGEGTGIHLIGGDVPGEHITHSSYNVSIIDGYATAIHADAGENPDGNPFGPGFLNDNKIPNVTVRRSNTVFKHTGESEAKLLVGGHIQGSNIDTGFDNQCGLTDHGSIRYDGHVEDIHQISTPASGPCMKINTRGGIPNLQGQSGWDLGPGTTVEGQGVAKADAEQPDPSNWRAGDTILFQDTGDGSRTGIYKRLIEYEVVKIGDFTPTSSFFD